MNKSRDYVSSLWFYCNCLLNCLHETLRMLSLPSLKFLLCLGLILDLLLLSLSSSCLDYVTTPKSTTHPRHCSLVDKESRAKGTTYPNSTIAASVVTSTKYWEPPAMVYPQDMVVGVWGHLIIACCQIKVTYSLLWKVDCIFMWKTSSTVENADGQLRKQTIDIGAPLLLGTC